MAIVGVALTQARREGGRGEVFPGPATFGGPAVAQKYWKGCSGWLHSNLASFYPNILTDMHKIHFRPGSEELTTLPRPIVGWWGDTPPYVSFISKPSAFRSRRIRNEVVIGPSNNRFPGPAVALDGPALTKHHLKFYRIDHTQRLHHSSFFSGFGNGSPALGVAR